MPGPAFRSVLSAFISGEVSDFPFTSFPPSAAIIRGARGGKEHRSGKTLGHHRLSASFHGQLRSASRNPSGSKSEAYGHDPGRYSGVDVDWRSAGLAAQPQLGLSSKRRPWTGPCNSSDSLFVGIFMRLIAPAALAISLLLVAGCSHQDTEKTKEEAAKATQQIKEGSKVAAVELKKDIKEVAKQTKAAAEGVKQGLQTPDKAVNVNSATKVQLQTLPGVDEETADRIIAGRPYHTTDELGTKGMVSPDEFTAIKSKITVK